MAKNIINYTVIPFSINKIQNTIFYLLIQLDFFNKICSTMKNQLPTYKHLVALEILKAVFGGNSPREQRTN